MKNFSRILKFVFYLAWCRNKARFVRTKIGSFWIGLTTLLMIGSLAFVYATVFKVQDTRIYIAYISLGVMFWNSLASLITDFSTLLNRSRERLLNTKITIIDIIFEEYIFQIQNLFMSFIMVVPAASIAYPKLLISIFSLKFILALSSFLLMALILGISISLVGLISADLHHLIPVVLQLSFLLSPVLYFKQNLVGKEWVYLYNPFYRPIGLVRDSAIYSDTVSLLPLLANLSISAGILYILLIVIRKNSRRLNLYVDT